MPEIYCQIGKLTVDLPQTAWGLGIESIIPPCDGCQHHGHLTRQKEINTGIEADKKIKLENLLIYAHNVSVIETFIHGPREEIVMCECNCRLTYPNFTRPV